jgi:WD40 repeat protein
VLIAGEKCLDPDTGEDTGDTATAEPWPSGIDPQKVAVHTRSVDGRWLAAGTSGGEVQLLDRRRPEHVVATLEAHQSVVGAMAFSPDGRWLATSAGDARHRQYRPREVILWRLEDLQPVRTLWGHTAGVQAIAFSPDGSYMATGGASQRSASHPGDVRLWHLPSLLIGAPPMTGSGLA